MPHLHWIGKEKVVNHHNDVPYRPLVEKETFGDPEDAKGNMIIHGDNLEALKSLLPIYEGRVDCIYIDPPYNTGNENWVYNDNVNHPKIKKWLGEVVGKEGEDLSRHDKWLCMMYPRLKLLHKLLSSKGSLVISINHFEFHNAIQICNEIFSGRNVSYITVQSSGGKPSNGFNIMSEYLIIISPKDFVPKPMLFTGGNDRSPFEGLTLSTFTKEERPNQVYPIYIDKNTTQIHSVGLSLQEKIDNGDFLGQPRDYKYHTEVIPEGCSCVWPITSKGKDCVWRLIRTRLLHDWNKGYIKVSRNPRKVNGNEYSIQYLPSGVISKLNDGTLSIIGKENNSPTLIIGDNSTVGGQIPTIWLEKDFFTVKGSGLLENIFGGNVFDYPKPIILIEEILRAITDENSIVLDSFAGSGTTAHAVMKLNSEDQGNRRYILVEMEPYAKSITAERVRRVIKGYGEGEKAVSGLGGGFSFYELGEPLFNEKGSLSEPVNIQKLKEYIWWIETKTPYQEQGKTYYLGESLGIGYYVFMDETGPIPLSLQTIKSINKKHDGYVVYAESCSLPEEFMLKNHITFKKIPNQIVRI